MKILGVIFGVFFVIITAVMIYLMRDGVSLRAAPMISPSAQDADYKNVAHALLLRLFPDFQNATHVLIGTPSQFAGSQPILNLLKEEYKKTFHKEIQTLIDNGSLTLEQVNNCSAPCWILTSETESNELSETQALPKLLDQLKNSNHFHLTIIPFQKVVEPPESCIAQKRLSLDCLISTSIHQVRKKMKKPDVQYFFMRKYNDRDYFLFTQTLT